MCGRALRGLAVPAIAASLLLTGCATERRQPADPVRPPSRPPVQPVRPAAPSAAEYVARAASVDLFIVRASEMALTRSQDERLRAFARDMISAHQGTAAQLSFAGRRLNLLPSASLRPEEQRMLDALAAEPQFDRRYWRDLVTTHEMAVDLHSNFAATGSSPTLKPVAAAAVPIYRRHLEQLRRMR